MGVGGGFRDIRSGGPRIRKLFRFRNACVFVFNASTQVNGCYAVVTFAGNGISYGSCADGYNGGDITNCAYTTFGNIKTSIGTQISRANLQGADGYKAFKKAIGSTTIWKLTGYPTLEGVNVRLPNNILPNV